MRLTSLTVALSLVVLLAYATAQAPQNASTTPKPTKAPVKVPKKPVRFIIGDKELTDARVIFNSPPNSPFVWTNYRKQGLFSLTYLSTHCLTFGVSTKTQSPSPAPTRAAAPAAPTPSPSLQPSAPKKDGKPKFREVSEDFGENFNSAALDFQEDPDDLMSFLETNRADTASHVRRRSRLLQTQKPAAVPQRAPSSINSYLYMTAGNTAITGAVSLTKPQLKFITTKGKEQYTQSQFVLVAADDFEETTVGWSKKDRSVCGSSPDFFLGGPCKFADTQSSKTYENLPPHKMIRITARYHFFDRWEGEYGIMKVDGRTVWSEAHHHCAKTFHELCKGISVCGDDNTADQLSTHISITIPHTAKRISVSFTSTLKPFRGPCIASWGVDDVFISVLPA